jgi:CubicO group peptidase (beta-lactamase class C family)
VVGLVDDSGARVIGYGKPAKDSSQTVDGGTVFQIASVTKTFTATLLADMVERGEVNLSDPISKYLPRSVKVPSRGGKEITFLDIATHTSGLPRDIGCVKFLCSNLLKPPWRWGNGPFQDKLNVEDLYEFLSSCQLTRDIGEKYEYSNYGLALLAHILSSRAGTDYETLVRTRILDPLDMQNTRVRPTPAMLARLAQGHDTKMKPLPNRDPYEPFGGVGALRSTADDLLKFVAANLGLRPSPLSSAMGMTHQPQRDTEDPKVKIGLVWEIASHHETEIVVHTGSLSGYRSFVGFDKKGRRGVVVLWNSLNDMDDIGFHLLESKYRLVKEHTAVKIDSRIFDPYVGEYELAPDFIVTFRRKGDRFFARATGQDEAEVFAETESDFFLKEADIQVTFVKDETGRVTHAVTHQNGEEQIAKKIK